MTPRPHQQHPSTSVLPADTEVHDNPRLISVNPNRHYRRAPTNRHVVGTLTRVGIRLVVVRLPARLPLVSVAVLRRVRPHVVAVVVVVPVTRLGIQAFRAALERSGRAPPGGWIFSGSRMTLSKRECAHDMSTKMRTS